MTRSTKKATDHPSPISTAPKTSSETSTTKPSSSTTNIPSSSSTKPFFLGGRVYKNALQLVIGTLFGIGLEKSKVYLPAVIISQMHWTHFTMLQTFLTATVASLVSASVLENLNIFQRSPKPPTALGLGLFKGYGANVIGGALVGAGMTLSGACPGTVFVQLGAGIATAPITLFGTFLGSITYGYIDTQLKKIIPSFGKKSAAITLDSPTKKSPSSLVELKQQNQKQTSLSFPIIATISVALLPAILYALESISPSSIELDSFTNSTSSFQHHIHQHITTYTLNSIYWPPALAGLTIGLSQFLSMALLNSPLGASSVFPYIGFNVVCCVDKQWEVTAPFYKAYKDLQGSVWMALGMVLGGLISTIAAGRVLSFAMPLNVFDGNVVLKSIVGGVLLVWGSRVAGGCTSGHGISGMAQLSVASVVTVASMFAGGSLLALVM
ncbi:hypothetical protein HDU76_006995 [Blyttiomyces sp. JEL0837]|nr:hypothetical protein HDU76_006995 [Blyttiomyces sp. JEL0837]